jgi:hypothetical protein
VFAERQANKARMRAEWVMKQREHETLDKFPVLRKFPIRGRLTAEVRQTTEACDRGNRCFRVFDVAAWERISEKNPAFFGRHRS